MNKAPAFQFYASDFLVGVMGMSDEEVGVYIKMLAMQWERGSLPNCPKSIKKMINSRKNPSENVLEKFQVGEDNSLRNERLEKERQKQKSFRESRVENANKRWEKSSTSNARAFSSICKSDALHSSSSPSSLSTDVKNPPTPQGGWVSSALEIIWTASPKLGRERSSRIKLMAELKKLPAKDRPTEDELADALAGWMRSESWTRDGGAFVPGIHRWVNGRQWENVPDPAESTHGRNHAGIEEDIPF